MFNKTKRSHPSNGNVRSQQNWCDEKKLRNKMRKAALRLLSSLGAIFIIFVCNITLADQVGTAIGIISEVGGINKVIGGDSDLDETLDVLESIDDLDFEMNGEDSNRTSELSESLSELRHVLKESGATEEEIRSEMSVFEKSNATLSSKVRSLRVLLKNAKRLQKLVSSNDKKKQTLIQSKLVEIEKEKLILEIERQKKEENEKVQDKIRQYSLKNSRLQSINNAYYHETRKLDDITFQKVGNQGAFLFTERNLRGIASYIGLFIIAVGIIGVTSGFFVSEGMWLLKSGVAFIVFVLILPEVFSLFKGLL
jgi:hypothetical protein